MEHSRNKTRSLSRVPWSIVTCKHHCIRHAVFTGQALSLFGCSRFWHPAHDCDVSGGKGRDFAVDLHSKSAIAPLQLLQERATSRNMANRRQTRSTTHESGANSDDDDFQPQRDSDDASYQPKKRKKTEKPSAPRKKGKTSGNDTLMSSVDKASSFFSPHAQSSHIIQSPAPIRVALLKWYETVKDTRGMPWRKPFDPTLGPEERSQRAYEVRRSHSGGAFVYSLYRHCQGLGFRSHASADPGRHSYSFL